LPVSTPRIVTHWFHQQHHDLRSVPAPHGAPRSTGAATTGAAVCQALQISRRFIKPGCPWTNGKAERFNRTLLTDWAYARPWTCNSQRTAALERPARPLQHSPMTHRRRRTTPDHQTHRIPPVNIVSGQDSQSAGDTTRRIKHADL
jgi:transposase InsO family protein